MQAIDDSVYNYSSDTTLQLFTSITQILNLYRFISYSNFLKSIVQNRVAPLLDTFYPTKDGEILDRLLNQTDDIHIKPVLVEPVNVKDRYKTVVQSYKPINALDVYLDYAVIRILLNSELSPIFIRHVGKIPF